MVKHRVSFSPVDNLSYLPFERRSLGGLREKATAGQDLVTRVAFLQGAAGPASRSHVSRFYFPEIDFLSNVNESGGLLFPERLERPVNAVNPTPSHMEREAFFRMHANWTMR